MSGGFNKAQGGEFPHSPLDRAPAKGAPALCCVGCVSPFENARSHKGLECVRLRQHCVPVLRIGLAA